MRQYGPRFPRAGMPPRGHRAQERLGQTDAPQPEAETVKDFYIYRTEYDTLEAGTTQTQNFTVEADSDFMMHKLTYEADDAGDPIDFCTAPLPLVKVLITDTGSGRQLSQAAIPVTSYFGDGRLPFIMPTPKLFMARSVVQVQCENFSGDTTYDLRLAFIGYKIFRFN